MFGAGQQLLDGVVELDDTSVADRWRKEWLYSRAATIYGGTSEIARHRGRAAPTPPTGLTVDALSSSRRVEHSLLDLASRFDGEGLTRALDEFGWNELLQLDPVESAERPLLGAGPLGSTIGAARRAGRR